MLQNYLFVPNAVETFGASKFIEDIGRKIHEKTGNKNETSYILQGISMSVQRGNAQSIMFRTSKKVGRLFWHTYA